MSAPAAEVDERPEAAERRGSFEELEEPFEDDSLILAAQASFSAEAGDDGQSYLMTEDFDRELGSPADNPFSDDYSSVSKYGVVDVAGVDRAGRPVVVVYAHLLPSNKTFNHALFLGYLQHTLDKFVDQDYVLIYFHYGLNSKNKPPIRWLRQAYFALDRKYKKNLKGLFVVHPSKFIKVLWNLFKPLLSVKFERKLHYVNFLAELNEFLHVDQLPLPQAILEYDAALQLVSASAKDGTPTPTKLDRSNASLHSLSPKRQFGVTLQFIMEHHPDATVPPLVTDLLTYLRHNGMDEEGLFRRSAGLSELRKIQRRVNSGDSIDWSSLNDVHLAAALLKAFLRELAEPLMTYGAYQAILDLHTIQDEKKVAAIKTIISNLPNENVELLKELLQFLCEVASHSERNKMDASNLSVVFGPNFAWPRHQHVSLVHLHHLNKFCYLLITNCDRVFDAR